jgi:hypothetical protein
VNEKAVRDDKAGHGRQHSGRDVEITLLHVDDVAGDILYWGLIVSFVSPSAPPLTSNTTFEVPFCRILLEVNGRDRKRLRRIGCLVLSRCREAVSNHDQDHSGENKNLWAFCHRHVVYNIVGGRCPQSPEWDSQNATNTVNGGDLTSAGARQSEAPSVMSGSPGQRPNAAGEV